MQRSWKEVETIIMISNFVAFYYSDFSSFRICFVKLKIYTCINWKFYDPTTSSNFQCNDTPSIHLSIPQSFPLYIPFSKPLVYSIKFYKKKKYLLFDRTKKISRAGWEILWHRAPFNQRARKPHLDLLRDLRMRVANKEQRVWGEKGELPLLSPLHLADKLIKRELVPETDVTSARLMKKRGRISGGDTPFYQR